jgi:hypothetical protein
MTFLKNKYTNSLFPAKLLWAKCKVVPIKQKMSSKKECDNETGSNKNPQRKSNSI